MSHLSHPPHPNLRGQERLRLAPLAGKTPLCAVLSTFAVFAASLLGGEHGPTHVRAVLL